MFTPLKSLTDLFGREDSQSNLIPHSVKTELVEAVNEVGEIIILEIPLKEREKKVSSPLHWLSPNFLFEP